MNLNAQIGDAFQRHFGVMVMMIVEIEQMKVIVVSITCIVFSFDGIGQ